MLDTGPQPGASQDECEGTNTTQPTPLFPVLLVSFKLKSTKERVSLWEANHTSPFPRLTLLNSWRIEAVLFPQCQAELSRALTELMRKNKS